ncbi:MAG: hypothetical protein PUA67_04275, partial [Ruminococcus sp.]|nr:hypothetical protein [Ruminococcus sp.]
YNEKQVYGLFIFRAPVFIFGYYTAVRNPQKLVATVSRREGVYNRTGEPSVIFAEKEELHSE